MTKANLVERMAKDAGVTKKAAEAALDSVLKGIRDSLKKGRKVTLVGFGTFQVSRRAARNGRNPQTGRAIRIPATKVPRFKPGKAFKNAVR
ncbi:MAG: HU family DNA-binding protein [candidate division NC10 bacterium]|nr:HU family DNA-binding protein [candidate division NC10 bacterium]